jgi:hypothetical protein
MVDTDVEQLLAGAPRDAIGCVLLSEPDELIAALLLQREWPWQEALLSRLAAPRRTRVLQAMHWAGGHTRRRPRRPLDAALIDGTARRVLRHRAIGGGASGQAPSGMAVSLRRWAVRTAARLPWRAVR